MVASNIFNNKPWFQISLIISGGFQIFFNVHRAGWFVAPKLKKVSKSIELHQILRLARKVTLELHQKLRLPRKMTLMINPVFTHETLFTMRRATQIILQRHQILRLPRKMTVQNVREIWWKQRSFTMRDRSDHDPRMKPSCSPQPASQPRLLFTSTTSILYWKIQISRSGNHSKFHERLRLPRKVTVELHQILHLPRKVTVELHQILRLPRKVTVQLHQILHLPRKVTLELHQILRLPRKVTLELHQILRLPRKVTLELHQILRLPRKVTLELHQILRLPHDQSCFHTWIAIYNAQSNTNHSPTSPNTAPATKSECHD